MLNNFRAERSPKGEKCQCKYHCPIPLVGDVYQLHELARARRHFLCQSWLVRSLDQG